MATAKPSLAARALLTAKPKRLFSITRKHRPRFRKERRNVPLF